MKKVFYAFLIAVLVFLVGTFIYDQLSNNDHTINPITCKREGQIVKNGSLGPNGNFGKCCSGLEPQIKPGEENIDGGGLYCTPEK